MPSPFQSPESATQPAPAGPYWNARSAAPLAFVYFRNHTPEDGTYAPAVSVPFGVARPAGSRATNEFSPSSEPKLPVANAGASDRPTIVTALPGPCATPSTVSMPGPPTKVE